MFDTLAKFFNRELKKNDDEFDKYVEFWKYVLNTFPPQVIKELHERRFNIETNPTSGRSYDFTLKDIFWWKETMRDKIITLKPIEQHKQEVKDYMLDIVDKMKIDESDKETREFIIALVEEKLNKKTNE